MEITPIAKIYTDFPSKFGIPRQSGRVKETYGKIIFEKDFRNDEFIRGIEQFSHIWLIWEFSENSKKDIHPTVRPPRLGGNTRMGVFATRSPFRPNALGLSCVELAEVEKTKNDGNILIVKGADIMNKTPIYDIKPYIPLADCISNANGGYSETAEHHKLNVIIPSELKERIPINKINAVKEILADDPRPAYQEDKSRIYGLLFSDFEIKFSVDENDLIITDIIKE